MPGTRPLLTAELATLGLRLESVRVETPEFQADTIIGQAPVAGSLRKADAVVTVEVAVAPELPEEIVVPDVTGLSESEARQLLAAAGVPVEVVVEAHFVNGALAGEPGFVWQQSPPADTELESGQTAVIRVSPENEHGGGDLGEPRE